MEATNVNKSVNISLKISEKKKKKKLCELFMQFLKNFIICQYKSSISFEIIVLLFICYLTKMYTLIHI